MPNKPERWNPVRWIKRTQRCDFCWDMILRGVPGNRPGDSGTKAWYNPDRNVWECLGCRTEGFRAEGVR